MTTFKVCRTCGETKPISAFSRHCTNPDGRRNDCRQCGYRLTREWILANPEKIRARERLVGRRRDVLRKTGAKKKCRTCGRMRPIEEFGKHCATRDGVRDKCRRCSAAYASNWRHSNPEKNKALKIRSNIARRQRYFADPEFRARHKAETKAYREALPVKKRKRMQWRNHLITCYKLSLEEYEAMLAEQKGRCACCKRAKRKLHVDHNHDTGRVRGLLCASCNHGIGQLGDTLETLMRAVRYLKRNS